MDVIVELPGEGELAVPLQHVRFVGDVADAVARRLRRPQGSVELWAAERKLQSSARIAELPPRVEARLADADSCPRAPEERDTMFRAPWAK